MLICPYCNQSNADGNAFCSNCGAQLAGAAPQQNASFEPGQGQQAQTGYGQQPQPAYNQPPTYQQAGVWNNVPQVVPVSTGGLMAWSIITILLCTIPGIVALVNTLNINKATTVEEQQKKLSAAKTWCIIGTVLGVLAIIGTLAAGS